MMAHRKAPRFLGLLGVGTVFLLMGLALFAERSGIRADSADAALPLLDAAQVQTAAQAMEQVPVSCLLLYSSADPVGMEEMTQLPQIFQDMKVGFCAVDVSARPMPELTGYRTVVVSISDLSVLGEEVLTLADWVRDGGRVMFAAALQKEPCSMLLEQKLGILSSSYDCAQVDAVRVREDFMLGGGRTYGVMDGFESAWEVELGARAEVFADSGGEDPVPLIWRTPYGAGCFVVVNLGFCEKAYRGFYAAAYSLLEPVCAWPVIDGAAFYIDDFPSPVPEGDGAYLRRDYGATIEEFYTNVWWPDMLAMAERCGVRYTGVIIETYEDDTVSPPLRQTDTERFRYFGGMLLRAGGELGWHGYNHQPLCLPDTDYGEILPYHPWPDADAMEASLRELDAFARAQFPDSAMSVYVPPSNVLSPAGRALLAERFPAVRTIASSYFGGELAYEQEFGVAADGIVEQPRVTSGALLDDYTRMTALSELNLHFVSNHFLHPDDLLDEDRGAALGWEELKGRLDGFLDWLYASAPPLRRMTGSELSGAVQRYAQLTVETERSGAAVTLRLGNFVDEASLLVRLNDCRPGEVRGGSLIRLTDTLYLLRAQSGTVTILLEKEDAAP